MASSTSKSRQSKMEQNFLMEDRENEEPESFTPVSTTNIPSDYIEEQPFTEIV